MFDHKAKKTAGGWDFTGHIVNIGSAEQNWSPQVYCRVLSILIVIRPDLGKYF